MVVLPQPLWPMMQTNSPSVSPKLTPSNTGSVLPGRPGQALDLQELSLHRSPPLQLGEHRVEQHADHADHRIAKITLAG